MVDQKLIDCIMAHNKDFPDRNIDPDKEQYRRGFVMFHFIKDLQILLGTNPDGTLGPTDEIAFKKNPIIPFKECPYLKVIRWAMWCKGYRGGDINNNIYGDTEFIEGLNKLQTDSGMNINNCISFITLKSIFSMDAYVLIPDTNGDAKIREMQQKMNAVTYKYCGVSPCDGLPQMKLTKQIIRYMQIIANDSNDMDGIFGNKTLENFLNLIESKKYEAITVLQLLLRING